MITVRVPATSANMGPGFDSIGIALNLYNTFYMEENDSIEIFATHGEHVPSDESNLIYQCAKRVYDICGKPMPGLKLIEDCDIPQTRGLGSSSACTVAGLIGANALLGNPLPGVGSSEQAAEQAARLTRIAPQVVVTGVTGLSDGRCIGCVGAARGGQGYSVKTPLIPRMYHGTGDIFGAVLVGRILQGNVPQAAVQAAAAFVSECIRQTPEGTDERLGVWLEAALPKLMQQ